MPTIRGTQREVHRNSKTSHEQVVDDERGRTHFGQEAGMNGQRNDVPLHHNRDVDDQVNNLQWRHLQTARCTVWTIIPVVAT